MCLIGFAWRKHPRYRLVLAANRDEFHGRPGAPAQAWRELPGVHGGRDLTKGGSWLLATESDRFAAVTNVRNPNRKEGEGLVPMQISSATANSSPLALLRNRPL